MRQQQHQTIYRLEGSSKGSGARQEVNIQRNLSQAKLVLTSASYEERYSLEEIIRCICVAGMEFHLQYTDAHVKKCISSFPETRHTTQRPRKSHERSRGQKASSTITAFAEENGSEGGEECFSMSSGQRSFAASVPHRSSTMKFHAQRPTQVRAAISCVARAC